jgi:hypothetical protein
MHQRIAYFLFFVFLAVSGPWAQVFEVPDTAGTQWFKGNTHAHTNASDGDSTPQQVADWYREHGYQFLVFSDHNTFTQLKPVSSVPGFLTIGGEELSRSYQGKMLHVNALNISRDLLFTTASSPLSALQANIDAVREAGGVPQINHPNTDWAIDQETLLRLTDVRLFELANRSPNSSRFNAGDASHPGLEAVWDFLLGSGKRIYGVASDDAQHLKIIGPTFKNPGRGWVVVRARNLDPAEIVGSLESGMFYASTGIVLGDVRIEPRRMSIAIEGTGAFQTEFVGAGGKVLLSTASNPAVYELSGDEAYVRARLSDAEGRQAWVQPVFVHR